MSNQDEGLRRIVGFAIMDGLRSPRLDPVIDEAIVKIKQLLREEPVAKICAKCGKVQLFDGFYAHPGMADGHLNVCKDCFKREAKERWRAKRSLVTSPGKSA
jgi:hypothetical protein